AGVVCLPHLLGGPAVETQEAAFHAWADAERKLWTIGRGTRRTSLLSMWPLPLPARLLERFVAVARDLPFPRERAFTLARITLVHGVARPEALAAVRAFDGPDRVFGLLALARILEGSERTAALSEVLAAVRARRWGLPSEAWKRADLDWQPPGAIEPGWTVSRTASELLATVAQLVPADERI